MIDWKSIKKAADGYPMVTVSPLSQASRKPYTDNFQASLVSYGGNGKPNDSSNLNKSAFSARMNTFGPLGKSYHGGSRYPGVYFTTLRRGKIRGMLYGNEAKAKADQDWAVANRWRILMSQAKTEADRRNLEARRAAGQLPPILMRNAFSKNEVELDDKSFQHPGEYVQGTFIPGGRKSMSWPWENRFVVASPEDWDMTRLGREETAHSITPTITDRQSPLLAVPGGDAGLEAYGKGQAGSYELNPGEMTRMALLAKAAASRLGYGSIRSVEDLETFLRQPSWKAWNGANEPVANRPDYPYDPRRPGQLDISTQSKSLLNVIDTLRWHLEHETDPKKQKFYQEEYNRLYMALQDAVWQARTDGGSSFGTTA
jgi:hypothetical protein